MARSSGDARIPTDGPRRGGGSRKKLRRSKRGKGRLFSRDRQLSNSAIGLPRFPFPFLTLTVSLEAIFLALFVLASQNRLARQADRRSHLDLQIDLLAEREMTAVLHLLQDIADAHLDRVEKKPASYAEHPSAVRPSRHCGRRRDERTNAAGVVYPVTVRTLGGPLY